MSFKSLIFATTYSQGKKSWQIECTHHWYFRLAHSLFNFDVATDISSTSNIETGAGKKRSSIAIYIAYLFLYLLLQ